MAAFASTPPRVPLVVSTNGIASLTVTVSPCWPGSMVRSTRISEPTSTTTFSRSSLLNPGSSARTVYVPGIRLGALYSPASSVVRVRARPLSLSIMLTVAPGMTAPVESLTLPRIRPKLPCANSGKENSNTTTVVVNRHEVILRFDVTDVISPSYPNAAHDRGRQHLSKSTHTESSSYLLRHCAPKTPVSISPWSDAATRGPRRGDHQE